MISDNRAQLRAIGFVSFGIMTIMMSDTFCCASLRGGNRLNRVFSVCSNMGAALRCPYVRASSAVWRTASAANWRRLVSSPAKGRSAISWA
jgi:hypothetical protein